MTLTMTLEAADSLGYRRHHILQSRVPLLDSRAVGVINRFQLDERDLSCLVDRLGRGGIVQQRRKLVTFVFALSGQCKDECDKFTALLDDAPAAQTIDQAGKIALVQLEAIYHSNRAGIEERDAALKDVVAWISATLQPSVWCPIRTSRSLPSKWS